MYVIDLPPINTLEIHFIGFAKLGDHLCNHSVDFEIFHQVFFHVRAFLKHLPKNISAILTICDDVSILRFRYMLRSNTEYSGGLDPSN